MQVDFRGMERAEAQTNRSNRLRNSNHRHIRRRILHVHGHAPALLALLRGHRRL